MAKEVEAEFRDIEDGIKMDVNCHFAVIIDENGSKAQDIIKATGLNGTPFLTLPFIPLEPLFRHKIEDVDGQDRMRVTKIGEGYYNAVFLAQLLKETGNKDVEFFQAQKDFPLGVKTSTHRGGIAPVLIGSEDESDEERKTTEEVKAKVPKLQQLIKDYFVGKKKDSQTFSLKAYAAKR